MAFELVVSQAVPNGTPGKTVDEIWRTIRQRTDLEIYPQRWQVENALRELHRRGTVARVIRPADQDRPSYAVYWRPVQALEVGDNAPGVP